MFHAALSFWSLFFLLGLTSIPADYVNDDVCAKDAKEDVCDVYRQDYGAPIPSYTVSRTCGKDGPIVTEDTTFFKLLAAFVREKIQARIVAFKGAGAHGYFEVTHDITKYTKAVAFSHIGQKTPVFCRFAVSAGADTTRGVTTFAVKFYTTEGNWDLLSVANLPIFIVRDPILFMSSTHSRLRNPVTGRIDLNQTWDFFTKRHDTLNAALVFFSDAGTPYSYRHMNGFAEHAFVFVNKQNEPIYAKFTWKTDQGVRNNTQEEAEMMAGKNPDWSTQDLYDNIEAGNYPSWTLCIQLLTFEQAKNVSFNPIDPTAFWFEDEFPCRPVGKLVLNKNPSNYFAEVEQVGFSISQLIRGIQPSQDRVLQGRMFAYDDAQRYRLGINSHQLPINQPRGVPCCPHTINRDGAMNYYNQPGEPDYYPSSFSHLHPDPSAEIRNYRPDGTVGRHDPGDHADYVQARTVYEKYSNRDKEHLAKNIGNSLRNVIRKIQCRVVRFLRNVSDKLAKSIERYAEIECLKKDDE